MLVHMKKHTRLYQKLNVKQNDVERIRLYALEGRADEDSNGNFPREVVFETYIAGFKVDVHVTWQNAAAYWRETKHNVRAVTYPGSHIKSFAQWKYNETLDGRCMWRVIVGCSHVTCLAAEWGKDVKYLQYAEFAAAEALLNA